MANVLDYIRWRGDLSFERAPLCEVDALILSELSYIDFSDVIDERSTGQLTLRDACARCFALRPYRKDAMGLLVPDSIQELLLEAAECPRFGGMRLGGYVNVIDELREEQFSAITFEPDPHTLCVIFRGTDDTIVGWKENFNMSFMFPVPAQRDAADYLDRAAEAAADRRLILAGHSKGGNLAVYAAAYCSPETQARVAAVYNFDGPGFPTPQIATENYSRIRVKISNFTPQASVVGILLEHESEDDFKIVRSSAVGAAQHDGMSWEVQGAHFVTAEAIASSSRRAEKTMHAWLNDMTPEQRRIMVSKMFAMRSQTDAHTLLELSKSPKKTLAAMLASLDRDSREVLTRSFRALMRDNRESIMQELTEALREMQDTIEARRRAAKTPEENK